MDTDLRDLKGRFVDGFRLIRLLGWGGMGAVYEALDVRLQRTVALKLLLRPEVSSVEWREGAKRLSDEARATAKVRHPYLVEILAAGEDSTLGPYVVYEYLAHGTLRERLEAQGVFSYPEVLHRVGVPVLEALQALHDAGIVHRDVKPENLLADDTERFKLGDLGLALFEGREAQTKTGVLVGTPGYVAPEWLLEPGEKPLPSGDIYAAAVVLVESLTGSVPFKGRTATEMVLTQTKRDTTASDLIALGVQPAPAHVLAVSLQRDPRQRHPTAKRLLCELRTAQRPTKVKKTVQSKVVTPTTGGTADGRWIYALPVGLLVLALTLIALWPFLAPDSGPTQPDLPPHLGELDRPLLAQAASLAKSGPLAHPKMVMAFLTQLDSLAERLQKQPLPAGVPDATVASVLSDLTEDSVASLAARAAQARLAGKPSRARNLLLSALRELSNSVFLKGTDNATPTDVALETFLLSRLFAVEQPSLDDAQDWILESWWFLDRFPPRLRRSRQAEHHVTLLLLFLARALCEGKRYEDVDDVVPAIDALARTPHASPLLQEAFQTHLKAIASHATPSMKGLSRVSDEWAAGGPRPMKSEDEFAETVKALRRKGRRWLAAAEEAYRKASKQQKACMTSVILDKKAPTDFPGLEKATSKCVSYYQRSFFASNAAAAATSARACHYAKAIHVLVTICRKRTSPEYIYFLKHAKWGPCLDSQTCSRRALGHIACLAFLVDEASRGGEDVSTAEAVLLKEGGSFVHSVGTLDPDKKRIAPWDVVVAPYLNTRRPSHRVLSDVYAAAYDVQNLDLSASRSAFTQIMEDFEKTPIDPAAARQELNGPLRLLFQVCRHRWGLLRQYGHAGLAGKEARRVQGCVEKAVSNAPPLATPLNELWALSIMQQADSLLTQENRIRNGPVREKLHLLARAKEELLGSTYRDRAKNLLDGNNLPTGVP